MTSKAFPSLISNSLTRLDLYRTNKKGSLLPSLHHFNGETGRTKQKRSDRRSKIITLLHIMIPQMDLDTLKWGQFFTNRQGQTDFYTRGFDYLVEKSGLTHKAVCRSISDLEKAGYIKVKRSKGMGKHGKEIRHYSLRTFTPKFFRELGFKNRTIEVARAWKRKKSEVTFYKQKATTSCLEGIGKIRSIFNKHAAPKQKFKSMHMPSQKISPTDTSNLLHKASEIAARTGRSPMDVYRELTRQ